MIEEIFTFCPIKASLLPDVLTVNLFTLAVNCSFATNKQRWTSFSSITHFQQRHVRKKYSRIPFLAEQKFSSKRVAHRNKIRGQFFLKCNGKLGLFTRFSATTTRVVEC